MPTHDSQGSDATSGFSASFSFSHTIAAQGNNRVLLLFCYQRGNSYAGTKATSITFNGVAPTGQLTPDIEEDVFSNFVSCQCFYWLEADLPSNGSPTSYTLSGTAGSGSFVGGFAAVSCTGGEQSAPSATGRASDSNNVPSPTSVSITTTEDDTLVYDAAGVWHSGGITNLSPNSGQTEAIDLNVDSADQLAIGYETFSTATTDSASQSWTGGNAALWSDFAVGIAPASGGGPSGVNIELGNLGTGTDTPFSHTLTDSENRGVLVFLDDEGTVQPTQVTYDGVDMTQVVSATSTVGAGNVSAIWFILDEDLPASAGSYTVDVIGAFGGDMGVVVVEVNNVAQVIPAAAQYDDADAGAVATISCTATSPNTLAMCMGVAGHGNDATAFDATPSGTGTWTRMTTGINPPTSAHMVTAYQEGLSGSVTYTETSAAAWNRASQCLAIFEAVAEAADENTFFAHCR